MADEDFTGYVGARWPSLVRTLVLMGCPADLAPDVATTGLARCRRGWREASEHDDLEVVVHRSVLLAWEERLRGPWWSGLRPPADEGWPPPDLSALDRLTPEVRAGLVLRRFSSLDVAQAVAVAGRDAGGPLPHTPDAPALRAAAESVLVYAPPDEEALTDLGSAAPRRRRIGVVAGAVAVALVLGGGTWWADRSSDDSEDAVLEAVEPSRARNPADVAWYSEGVLHLTNATYPLPQLLQLGVLGAGAAYGDTEGNVVHLADDGTRTLLGTKDPGSPLVTSDEEGRVAWVDPDGPTLKVYDLSQAEIVGELDLPPSLTGPEEMTDTRPTAFDREFLYYATSDGWGRWAPGEPEPEETGQGDLFDVSSSNRMFQLDDRRISLDQPFFNVVYEVPGRGGGLSADGNYAFTRSPDDGRVLVYDTRSGDLVDVSPPDPDRVIDVVLDPPLAVTYITVDQDAFPQQEGSDSNRVQGEIVTCQLDDGECETAVTLVLDSEAPILAR